MWIGPDFAISDYDEANQLDEHQYVQECINSYWGAKNVASLNIKVINEQPDMPSDAFQSYFD